jgi:hypothetical protein
MFRIQKSARSLCEGAYDSGVRDLSIHLNLWQLIMI